MNFSLAKESLVAALKRHHSTTKQFVAAQRDYEEERQRLLSGAPFVNPSSGTTERFLYSALGNTEREREAVFLIIFDEQYPGFRKQLQTLEDAVTESTHQLKLAQLEYDSYLYELRSRELERLPARSGMGLEFELSSQTSLEQNVSERPKGLAK